MTMSKLERDIEVALSREKIQFSRDNAALQLPLDSWPWKRPGSRKPRCDFFIPSSSIYVEVKGFMTIHAMAQLSWLSRNETLRYFILQGTENDWNPYLDSPLGTTCPPTRTTATNIDQQIAELKWLTRNDPVRSSRLSLSRLKDYIRTRIDEYTAWNGQWY